MKYRFLPHTLLLAGSLLLAASCNNDPKNKNHGPIVLGDSSTIVNESDPVYLQDQVPDLRPITNEEASTETDVVATPAKDSIVSKPAPQPIAAQPQGNGLTIGFKEITLFIPNITTKTYGRQDLQSARGATYELSSGNLAGNQIRASNGKVEKITQRYQTVLALQDGSEKLQLESLGTYSSDWQTLNGNGSYTITGLEPSRLGYDNPRPAAIRNAVQASARRARMSRGETQDWLDVARDVRAVNQKPCVVVLRSVSWRITGKDAAGKTFNKEVRMDMPR